MDLSQQEQRGYPLQPSQSRIGRNHLNVIGFEVRALADKIKDLGLIDYEQGFNERRITEGESQVTFGYRCRSGEKLTHLSYSLQSLRGPR